MGTNDHWMSVDPGLERSGWARWRGDRLVDWGLAASRDLHTTGWLHTARLMSARVYSQAVGCYMLVSEMPEEFHSAKGNAALNSGSVRKLALYVGMIGGRMLVDGRRFEAVTPTQWKGQLPKEITRKRVLRSYPDVEPDLASDVYDAIGIGRWWIRKRGL